MFIVFLLPANFFSTFISRRILVFVHSSFHMDKQEKFPLSSYFFTLVPKSNSIKWQEGFDEGVCKCTSKNVTIHSIKYSTCKSVLDQFFTNKKIQKGLPESRHAHDDYFQDARQKFQTKQMSVSSKDNCTYAMNQYNIH